MSLKKDFVKNFKDKELFWKLRYESSKNFFAYSSLIFFLNYFFVWADFFAEIFFYTLPFSFISFLVSFSIYLFLYFSKKLNSGFVVSFIVFILLIIMNIVFLYPFLGIDLLELININ